jgi:hypothetical protein
MIASSCTFRVDQGAPPLFEQPSSSMHNNTKESIRLLSSESFFFSNLQLRVSFAFPNRPGGSPRRRGVESKYAVVLGDSAIVLHPKQHVS